MKGETDMKGSFGFIETRGFVPAVAAADAGMKAANVSLQSIVQTTPALITVTFRGDVAAVRAAVSSASAVAESVGELVSSHVIARTQPELAACIVPPLKAKPVEKAPAQAQKTPVKPSAKRAPAKRAATKKSAAKASAKKAVDTVKKDSAVTAKASIEKAVAKSGSSEIKPQIGPKDAPAAPVAPANPVAKTPVIPEVNIKPAPKTDAAVKAPTSHPAAAKSEK